MKKIVVLVAFAISAITSNQTTESETFKKAYI